MDNESALRTKICQEFIYQTDKTWNYITPVDFYHNYFLKKQAKKDYVVIDLRHPRDFKKFHIHESENIFWMDICKKKNLDKIPRNIPVFLICYVGHTSSQTLVLLRILGLTNVVSIKFGYGISPSFQVPVAGWISYNYPVCGTVGVLDEQSCRRNF
jgi:rhodanese-related sulfurtransferase